MLDFPRWKVVTIWTVLALLCALAIPTFLPESTTANWPFHPRVNKGLDLAGGSYLMLEADTADLAPDRRLHATGGQARLLYAELARNLATRAAPDGGAMRNVLERFVAKAVEDGKRTGRATEDAIRFGDGIMP